MAERVISSLEQIAYYFCTEEVTQHTEALLKLKSPLSCSSMSAVTCEKGFQNKFLFLLKGRLLIKKYGSGQSFIGVSELKTGDIFYCHNSSSDISVTSLEDSRLYLADSDKIASLLNDNEKLKDRFFHKIVSSLRHLERSSDINEIIKKVNRSFDENKLDVSFKDWLIRFYSDNSSN